MGWINQHLNVQIHYMSGSNSRVFVDFGKLQEFFWGHNNKFVFFIYKNNYMFYDYFGETTMLKRINFDFNIYIELVPQCTLLF